MDDFLLKENYVEIDRLYAKIVFKCKKCGGLGYVEKDFDEEQLVHNTKDCSCRRKYLKLVDNTISNLPKKFFGLTDRDIVEKRCKDADIVTFLNDKSVTDKTNKLYKDFVIPYSKNFNKVLKNGYSFLFVGPNGCGKTFAAAYIVNKISRKRSKYYISFRDLMRLSNLCIVSNDNNCRKKYNTIKNVELLVIDEVGKESSVTTNLLFEFENLVKGRIERFLPTIIITNKNLGFFVEHTRKSFQLLKKYLKQFYLIQL